MAVPSNRPLIGRHDLYKAAQDKAIAWLVDASQSVQSFGNSGTASKLKSTQLVTLAEVVRDAGVKVPLANISLLQGVIESREACADWYRKIASSKPKDNNGRIWFVKLRSCSVQMLQSSEQTVCRDLHFHERRPQRREARLRVREYILHLARASVNRTTHRHETHKVSPWVAH